MLHSASKCKVTTNQRRLRHAVSSYDQFHFNGICFISVYNFPDSNITYSVPEYAKQIDRVSKEICVYDIKKHSGLTSATLIYCNQTPSWPWH